MYMNPSSINAGRAYSIVEQTKDYVIVNEYIDELSSVQLISSLRFKVGQTVTICTSSGEYTLFVNFDTQWGEMNWLNSVIQILSYNATSARSSKCI